MHMVSSTALSLYSSTQSLEEIDLIWCDAPLAADPAST